MAAKLSSTEEVKTLFRSLEDEDVSEDFVEEDLQEDLVEYNDSIFDMEY